MPTGTAPTTSLVTLRPDLVGAIEQFDLDANARGMIGPKIAPPIPTSVKSGNFGYISAKDLLKNPETRRKPGSGYNTVWGNFTPDTFACEEHGLVEYVDDDERRQFGQYIDSDLLAMKRARSGLLIAYETALWAKAHAISATGARAGGYAWTNHSSATPYADVLAAQKVIFSATGMWPNAMVMSKYRWKDLIVCDELINKIKYSGGYDVLPSQITTAMVAQALDLDHVILSAAAYNAAHEGQAVSAASLWTDSEAVVLRLPLSDDHREPCWARTFIYDGSMAEGGDTEASQFGVIVEQYREEGRRSDAIRVRWAWQIKEIYAAAAYRISGI